ncbi:MAG TPA: hypothetical protein VGY77_06670 [Gemmataceae bacterium]|nr:hypothetical protein [Gemmataceae bacterium]
MMKLGLDFADVLRQRARRRDLQTTNAPWLASDQNQTGTSNLGTWKFQPPDDNS